MKLSLLDAAWQYANSSSLEERLVLLNRLIDYSFGPLSDASGFTDLEMHEILVLFEKRQANKKAKLSPIDFTEADLVEIISKPEPHPKMGGNESKIVQETIAALAGQQQPSVALPAVLTWFYQTAGKKIGDIFCRRNRFGLWELDEYNRIILYKYGMASEFEWAVELVDNDPRVWFCEFQPDGTSETGWIQEDASLSQFLIMIVLTETIFFGEYCASAAVYENKRFETFVERLSPIALPSFVSWLPSTRFFSYGGLFAITYESADAKLIGLEGDELCVSAKEPEAFDPFKEYFPNVRRLRS